MVTIVLLRAVLLLVAGWLPCSSNSLLLASHYQHRYSRTGGTSSNNSRSDRGPPSTFLEVLRAATENQGWGPLQQQSVNDGDDGNENGNENDDEEPIDTIRVRIWRVLATGKEYSLKELGTAVGERRSGELRHHLQHVAKQAQTLRNKSRSWRERRGLDPDGSINNRIRLVTRRTNKEYFLRLRK